MHTVERYHDISTGHRVHNHESKCAHLHGHNYRVHFSVSTELACHMPVIAENELDSVGRVIDFSVVKERLCMWLENNWDHKFLAWEEDPVIKSIYYAIPGQVEFEHARQFQQSIVWVPFNPTAENMAQYLVDVIGPQQLEGTDVVLRSVRIEETRKCSVVYRKEG
jgi:6-pyruvoyltetrahydropterin/6-carboxytetrahydropterin synthase